jgi:hypothetical protein
MAGGNCSFYFSSFPLRIFGENLVHAQLPTFICGHLDNYYEHLRGPLEQWSLEEGKKCVKCEIAGEMEVVINLSYLNAIILFLSAFMALIHVCEHHFLQLPKIVRLFRKGNRQAIFSPLEIPSFP